MSVPPTYKQGAKHDQPGTIGVQSGELTRYADFTRALVHLGRPEGSKLVWVKSVDIIQSVNKIVQATEGDWLFLMGDDHVFNPNILMRLLSHNVDVIVPYCLQRMPPFAPVVYKGQDPDTGHYYVYDDLPAKGVVEVHAAGNAGMLIRKHVLDAIEPPHFQATGKGLGEDLYFCARVREAGFKIHCDVETPLGHINQYIVWPTRDDFGGWGFGLELDADTIVNFNRPKTVTPPVMVK